MIVGLTERHGMAVEQSNFPPDGITYHFLECKKNGSAVFKSPMKGFFSTYQDADCDLMESILTPSFTNRPWLYSLARFEEALAFSVFGLPIPRTLRIHFMKQLFLRDNFKGLLFWSQAGLETLESHGGITDKRIRDKSFVVYPAIRSVPESHIKYSDNSEINLLFNGNFFIKGGANVVDLFEEMQKKFNHIKLRLCCDLNIDFHTEDQALRTHYLERIQANPAITMGRVKRDEFVNQIMPNTDIYLLPTYGDAFGFAVLEAMAHGIPVVSTNYMALPEMIDHGENGFLANISRYPCEKLFKGCVVNALPEEFRLDINQQLAPYLSELIASANLRKIIGKKAITTARERFSFEVRTKKMAEIYASLNLGVPS